MDSKFAVIGLGRFGSKIARQLSSRGAEVIAIDTSSVNVEKIKDDVAHPVQVDATDIKALKALKIGEMDAVVLAIGENFEALLLCAVQLMELKVKRIIARTGTAHQKQILSKLGITEILSPEEEVGILVAERLLHPGVKTFLQLPDGYEIAEIKPPKSVCNKSVGELELRKNYNLNLITINRHIKTRVDGHIVTEKHIVGVPQTDTMIYATDELILLGKEQDLDKFLSVNK